MDSKNKKKKSGSGGVALFVILILLLPRLFELLESPDFERRLQIVLWQLQRWMLSLGLDPELLPLIAVGVLALIIILIAAAKNAAKRRDVGEGSTKDYTSGGRTKAAAQRPDPRSRSFTPPEPSCVVCDHTGEDHFAHDKAQRIAQLDEWLKNGLIDREEYRVLKSRYERDL